MQYLTHTTGLTIVPEHETIYSERATVVSIDDEAGGCFVVVAQHGRSDIGKILIDPPEWPAIRDAIEAMLETCARIDSSSKGQTDAAI